MRAVIGATALTLLVCLAGDASAQEATEVTIRTVLDANRSSAYEASEDSLLSAIDVFAWKDLNRNGFLDYPSEPYWSVDGPSGGEAVLSIDELEAGDTVCAGEDFGPRIPESFDPYKIDNYIVCVLVDGERKATINLLNQEWPALIVGRSWLDSNGNGAQDSGEHGVGGQSFRVWVDESADGKLDTEATSVVTTLEHDNAASGGVGNAGEVRFEIVGPRTGDVVCVEPVEAPTGFHLLSYGAIVPFGSLADCQALTTNRFEWRELSSSVWPGVPAVAFIFAEAEGLPPSSLPKTGGPP